MDSILLMGASGFLGRYLRPYLQSESRLFAQYGHNRIDTGQARPFRCDLENAAAVDDMLLQTKPRTIIHLAALSSPNRCAAEPDRSRRLNLELTEQLVEYCRVHQVRLIFASTDLVFDGRHAPYDEDGPTAPATVYGNHKAESEKRVRELEELGAIVRLPLLFGWDNQGRNFLTDWTIKLQKGERIRAFTDEFRSALWAEDAARGLSQLAAARGLAGIFHFAGPERLSRYEFALRLAEVFELDANLIDAIRMDDLPMLAARVPDTALLNQRTAAFGWHPTPIRAALQQIRLYLPQA